MMTRRYVDVHAHVGRSVLLTTFLSVDEYVRLMDETGIERSILSHVAGGRQVGGLADTRAENDLLLDALRRDPQRFPLGLASFEARHAEHAPLEVERAMRAGLCGVAHHASFQTGGVGRQIYPALEVVAARRGLCLIHSMPSGAARPEAIGKAAADFPGALFLMAHPSMARDQHEAAVAVARERENVLLDIVYFQNSWVAVEDLVGRVGADRIFFGTDAPYGDLPRIRAALEEARIPDADKEAIAYGNGARLIQTLRDRFPRVQGA